MAVINIDDVYILGETGAEVDKVTGLYSKNENASDTEKAQARANIGAGGSNDNLLDNAYFVGGGSQLGNGVFPINQREQTSYSSYQVTIDRWTLFGGSVVLEADGITVTSSPDFGQVLEPSRLPVGTYTASVKTADGKIGSITFTTTGSQFFAGGAMGDTGVTLNFIDLWESDKTLFSLQCQGVKIAAAKLEKGTISTLANDAPPKFRAELANCQQYLYGLTFPGYAYTGQICFALDAQNINWNLTTPVPMVQNRLPSISVTNSLYANGVAISGITIVNYPYGNNIKISGQAGGMTNGQLYPITTSANEVKVLISTEL